MRRFLLALAVSPLALTACQGACGGMAIPPPPALTMRFPLLVDPEPASTAGERIRMVPMAPVYAAPQYVPATPQSRAFAPSDPCSPAFAPSSKSYTPVVPSR